MIARTTSETGEKNTSSSPSDLLLAKFFRKITSPSHISCKQINSNNIEPTNTPAENGKKVHVAPTGNRTQGKRLEGVYVTTTPLVLKRQIIFGRSSNYINTIVITFHVNPDYYIASKRAPSKWRRMESIRYYFCIPVIAAIGISSTASVRCC